MKNGDGVSDLAVPAFGVLVVPINKWLYINSSVTSNNCPTPSSNYSFSLADSLKLSLKVKIKSKASCQVNART
jgi:hypothetical protein